MGNFRMNRKVAKFDVKELGFAFLYGQGVSILLPLLIIEDGDKLVYHPFPFIFSPIFSKYFNIVYPTKGQTMIRVKQHNGINDVMTYRWSQDAYLRGNGLGGSFLGEMYDCGGVFGIIIWSIIAALSFRLIDRFLLKNMLTVIVFWFFIQSVAFLPRNRFFQVFGSDIYAIMTMGIAIMLIDLFIKYSKSKNNVMK
jgi:hypothetical protein